MKTAKTILFLTLFCCITTVVNAQITVDDNETAQDLVNKLIGTSSCVTISGTPPIKGDDYTPSKNSYGSFDSGITNFPISKGIILSTWSAKNSAEYFIREPISSPRSGTTDWKGDTDLETALNTTNTINATILEFDFTPQTNFISFDYIFASNEYQDYFPCYYSDGFAFLIKEKYSIKDYQNLAVLSDGTEVSSKNIHPKIEDFVNSNKPITKGCNPQNEEYFGQLNTISSPINYSGQTKILTAKTIVKSGTLYHIKLVIADQNERYFDSAVFLEEGSFSSKIDLGSDRLLATNNAVCFGKTYPININDALPGVSITNYKWYEDGIENTSETSFSLSVTKKGTYKVEATLSSGCVATGEIKIEFTPEIVKHSATLQLCDTGGSTFNLTKANTTLIGSNTNITKIEYYENYTIGSGVTNKISDPTAYLGYDNQIIYVKLTNNYPCSAEGAEIILNIVLSTPSLSSPTQPIINEFSGGGNSVTLVPPTTPSIYEYSLDETNYQNSPLFTNLIAGDYTGYIRDSSTCEYSINPFVILDYPNFFTPNEDGFNDEWEIKKLHTSYPKAIISIFDRYGKLLKQITSGGGNWKGTFNGLKLPTDDYWFTIDLKNGEIVKGHFSLKR